MPLRPPSLSAIALAGTLALATLATPCPQAHGANDYPLSPDSLPQEGVPKGRILDGTYTSTNSIFPGTTRPYSVYIPAQYDGRSPAALMVFQDGKGRANEWKVPTVFDNLIHRKEIPPVIGVFVSPGVLPAPNTNALPRFNRSFEYDSLGNRYARFLIEEFLPWIERAHNVVFTPNASGRALAGASSGAIAAFVAAWERPDSFSRVFSTIGTYVGLRGGNEFPTLIRKTEPKPIRIFLQDGSNDLNIYGGNWWIANQDMLSALQFAGYEVRHAWGDGGHDGKQGAAVFPDALRWLWQDYPKPVPASATSSNTFLQQILVPGEPWKPAAQGHLATSPTANAKGEIFFADPSAEKILKLSPNGKTSTFAENTGGSEALMFGADGKLYSLAANQQKLVRYDDNGQPEDLAEGFRGTDLVTLPIGAFFADPDNRKIWRLGGGALTRETDTEINRIGALTLSPDHSLLYVADAGSQWVWSFAILSDGSLTHGQPYFHLHIPDPAVDSGAEGMVADTDGRLYVGTRLGLQVCDQAGRVNAILPTPNVDWLSGVCFGGPNLDTLYVTCGNRIFSRRTQVRGAVPWAPPTKPAPPRL
jgi:enterochelin esterase-like enzyme/sugar lactone lactonase YvrE